jgi:predicted GH43/DUF377 family glycosyl hydrolase
MYARRIFSCSMGILLLSTLSYQPSFAQGTFYRYPDNPVLNGQYPFVLREGRTYSMWRGGITIWYLTSIDGKNWQEYAGNPILEWGPSGSWDDYLISSPSVMKVGDTYYMYYAGTNEFFWRIGLASSPDRVTWTKYSGNPVFNPGDFGEWDDQGVQDPMVIFDGTEYKMYYTGDDGSTRRIGLATSTDGLNWTRASNNPVLTEGRQGDWDSEEVAYPFVFYDGDKYYMYYSGYRFTYAYGPYWEIGLATSTDGYHWQKQDALNPVLRPQQQLGFDNSGVLQPSALLEEGIIKMWFTGNYHGGPTIGYARTEDPLFVDVTPSTTQVSPGGFIDLAVTVQNMGDNTIDFQLWSDASLPPGRPYSGNPVLGPEDLELGPGHQTFNGNFSIYVPDQAPPDSGYRLITKVGNYPDYVQDFSWFEFEVLP